MNTMRRTAILAFLLALLSGCAGERDGLAPAPTLPARPPTLITPTVAVPSPEGALDLRAAWEGIQATLDDLARAYNTGDAELLRTTVDQRNVPLRRLVQERFDAYQRASVGGGGAFAYRVTGVEPRHAGFVLAHINTASGLRADWLFREVDGRWRLSEPTEEQLGERFNIESEHFVFHTYAWSGDANQELAAMMEQARDQVVNKLGREPEGRYNVYVRPIFGLTPPADAGALAWYRAATRPRGDRIEIYAPGSYAFGAYDPDEGWQGLLGQVLVHEYTHLVHLRSFPEYYGLSDWMSEGLAEYVADNPRAEIVSAAVREGRIIPIVDRSNVTAPQDLDHLSLLERDVGLAYGLAYALTAHIVERYGGIEGFWNLAGAMRRAPGTGEARYDAAMREVFGVSFAEFDAGWREWLRQRY